MNLFKKKFCLRRWRSKIKVNQKSVESLLSVPSWSLLTSTAILSWHEPENQAVLRWVKSLVKQEATQLQSSDAAAWKMKRWFLAPFWFKIIRLHAGLARQPDYSDSLRRYSVALEKCFVTWWEVISLEIIFRDVAWLLKWILLWFRKCAQTEDGMVGFSSSKK